MPHSILNAPVIVGRLGSHQVTPPVTHSVRWRHRRTWTIGTLYLLLAGCAAQVGPLDGTSELPKGSLYDKNAADLTCPRAIPQLPDGESGSYTIEASSDLGRVSFQGPLVTIDTPRPAGVRVSVDAGLGFSDDFVLLFVRPLASREPWRQVLIPVDAGMDYLGAYDWEMHLSFAGSVDVFQWVEIGEDSLRFSGAPSRLVPPPELDAADIMDGVDETIRFTDIEAIGSAGHGSLEWAVFGVAVKTTFEMSRNGLEDPSTFDYSIAMSCTTETCETAVPAHPRIARDEPNCGLPDLVDLHAPDTREVFWVEEDGELTPRG